MTSSVPISKRRATEERRQRAWELHLAGANQLVIADELGVTQARVSQYIKQAAAKHPVNSLSLEERIALSEARWQISEDELRREIKKQQLEGRLTHEVITFPDGSKQIKQTTERGVDPALLRALSMHHDRRARQLNNQVGSDATVQQVNVSMVKEFLSQGDKPQARMTATEWNEQPIDV